MNHKEFAKRGIMTNLNEREHLAQSVRHNPDLLVGIIASAMDAIIAVDDAQRIVLFNAAAETVFACPANEAIGSSVERFIPQRFRAGHSTRVRLFAESGITSRTLHDLGTLFGLRATGKEFPMEASISKVESGGKKFFTVVIRDITERKRSEENARKSEERFRLAAHAGRMFAYEWDAATDLISRSPESAHILGISEAVPITGQDVLAKVHPDDRERLKNAVAALSPEKPYLQLSYRMIRPDDTAIWVERSSCAQFDEQGTLLRIIGMVADITERKRVEEALRASEERLRLAQQGARLGTFERDVRTGRITWSEGLESLYGVPPGSLDGKTTAFFKNLIHPADYEQTARLIENALKTGQPTEGEWRVLWPDGSVHWIASRWQVLMDASGEPSRVVGVNMDISERKRAEEARLEMNRTLEAQGSLLRSKEELLRVFVKNVPAAVAMLDRDMRYLQVSDRWCTDYLPGRAEILGRFHYEIFPDMPERWKEVHRRALQGEMLRADEDRWDGQDGPHWARWEVRPWKTAEGAVGGILILAEDITRRKQMEEALSDVSRKLIESQEQERTRIGRELHDDINQRLAMLSLELEQLQENPSEVQPRVKELRRQIAEVSNDVQTLSHDLHSSKLEYLGVVAGMKSWCKEFAERQKIEIDFRSDVSRVLPVAVGLSLFRVLQEALNNAIKHSGVKRIEMQLREDSGGEIHLVISDLGRGFDVEAASQGKGLGLTSMRERVRLVNGTISIESKLMCGTTIYVRVPLGSEKFSERAVG
jgi:PAS domain S-box-containing protein